MHMKELSIGKKAKRYDEAFKEASIAYKDEDRHLKATLERIFPELKESEDERIRGAIIGHLKDNNLTEWAAWLEKQGEQKHFAKYKVGDTIYYSSFGRIVSFVIANIVEDGTDNPMYEDKDGNSVFEKDIIKQKPAAKVEPKFHEGDWCIDNEDGTIFQIVKVLSNTYAYKTNEGKEYFCTHYSLENDARLWTIQDSKDGDVLFQDLMCGKTFIYNGVSPDMAILYSFIISNGGEDVLPYHIGKPNTGIGYIEENKNIIHPATKEQRDLLFSKMKEAGYVWDAEKKELKKVEQEQVIGCSDSLPKDNWELVHEFVEKFGRIPKDEDELNVLVEYVLKRQKPTDWSEDDERMYRGLHNLIYSTPYCDSRKELSDWLKSLKERYEQLKKNNR